jgi:hypothetical protein
LLTPLLWLLLIHVVDSDHPILVDKQTVPPHGSKFSMNNQDMGTPHGQMGAFILFHFEQSPPGQASASHSEEG